MLNNWTNGVYISKCYKFLLKLKMEMMVFDKKQAHLEYSEKHLLIQLPSFERVNQMFLCDNWALTMSLAHVFQYFHTRSRGKLTMLTHISEIGQFHNLYSERTIAYCSSALVVSHHLHPVKIPKAIRILQSQNFIEHDALWG